MPFTISSLNLDDDTLSVRYRRSISNEQIDCFFAGDSFYRDIVSDFIVKCITRGGVFIRMAEHDLFEINNSSYRELCLMDQIGIITNHHAWVYSYAMWSERDEWFLLSDQLAECFVLSTTKSNWEKIYGQDYEHLLKLRLLNFSDYISKVWVGLSEFQTNEILQKYSTDLRS